MSAVARIGIAGWTYAPWRGEFYPRGLPHRRELAYVAERLPSVEVNGTFYALQRPDSFRGWRAETPEGFVFAVKGPRFITHMKKLAGVEAPLANFLASGVLALGPKLGPVLWQLPPTLGFDEQRLDAFLSLLPRSGAEASWLARRHEPRMAGRAVVDADPDVVLRYAIEVRHRSFVTPAFGAVLRRHGMALVLADTAGRWPMIDEATADFAYLRLHGDQELYTSGYTAEALDRWAVHVRGVVEAGRDAYVYFDNDVKVRSPFDATSLAARLHDLLPPVHR